MTNRDTLRRFLFEDFPVRGKLVHLDAAWRAVLERHEYPRAVRDALGEAMAATALLAATLKFDGQLTLQLQGQGPLNLLVVQCTHKLALRGLAHWRDQVPDGSLADMSGEGRLMVSIDNRGDQNRYQGIVPLTGSGVAECLQAYFDRSEQLPTRFWLNANESRAVGLMLQKLPEDIGGPDNDVDGWPRVRCLAETLAPEELLGLDDRALLTRLYHEEDVRMFSAVPVSFRCSCSRDRVVRVLRMLGQEEVRQILEEEGEVSVRCEFCNKPYDFDAVDTGGLFHETGAVPGPRTTH